MAESKQHQDLTQCGICLSTQQEPKSLPCLHSYCLECLTQWAKDKPKVRCPVCLQEFVIPSGGVKAFRTNFFINTLKERQDAALILESRDTVVPCSCCGAVDEHVDGHCAKCGGFICGVCTSMHNRLKLFSNHKVIPYEDLKSGKVDIRNLSQKKYCKVHEDQVLWFYCYTCGILTCRDCTVIDHPSSSHDLVNLETASKEQKKEIEQLVNDCKTAKKVTVDVLTEIENVGDLLDKDGRSAYAKIDESFEKALKLLNDQRKQLKEEVKKAVSEKKKQLESQKDEVLLQQTRMQTSTQMATEVVTTGSDYDLALTYSSLKTNLTTSRNVKLAPVDSRKGAIDFKPAQIGKEHIPKLGSVVIRKAKQGVGVWKLARSFGDDGTGKLISGRGVAVTHGGNLAVADSRDMTIKIYSKRGEFKTSINVPGTPWDVVVSTNNQLFVTNQTATVRIYDVKGNLKHRFPTKSASNVSSDAQATNHWGLAIDNNNHLLVGEGKQKYISKHNQDGTHIKSFKVTIIPKFIAVSPDNYIIISCGSDGCSTHILNENGVHMHTLKLPQGPVWTPLGLCCTSRGEIYLSNYMMDAIYCYSAKSGAYRGCLVKDTVTSPAGLALMDDEQTLVVAEKEGIKILELQ